MHSIGQHVQLTIAQHYPYKHMVGCTVIRQCTIYLHGLDYSGKEHTAVWLKVSCNYSLRWSLAYRR